MAEPWPAALIHHNMPPFFCPINNGMINRLTCFLSHTTVVSRWLVIPIPDLFHLMSLGYCFGHHAELCAPGFHWHHIPPSPLRIYLPGFFLGRTDNWSFLSKTRLWLLVKSRELRNIMWHVWIFGQKEINGKNHIHSNSGTCLRFS